MAGSWSRYCAFTHDTKRAKPGARDREKLRQIDLHWHDLRREGTCRLLSDGVDIRTIQLMLGHADIKQTQRHLNITDEELRKAMTVYGKGAVNCAPWASKFTWPRSHDQRQIQEGLSSSSRYRLSVICQSGIRKVARPAGLLRASRFGALPR